MHPALVTLALLATSAPLGAKGDVPPPRLDGLPCSVGCEDCAFNGKGQCSQSECGADTVELGDFHCTLPWNGSSDPVRCCLPKECTSDAECEEGKICGARFTCREPSCAAIGGTCRAPDMAQAGAGGNTPPACLPDEVVKYYDRTTCFSECGYFWGQCGQTCCLPRNGTGAMERTGSSGPAATPLPTTPTTLPILVPPHLPARPLQPSVPAKILGGVNGVPDTVARAAAFREKKLGGILGEKGASPTRVWGEAAVLALVAVLALALLLRVDTTRAETPAEREDAGLLQQARE